MKGQRLIGKRKQKLIERMNFWGNRIQKLGINANYLINSKKFGLRDWRKLTTKELTGYCSRLADFYYSQKA